MSRIYSEEEIFNDVIAVSDFTIEELKRGRPDIGYDFCSTMLFSQYVGKLHTLGVVSPTSTNNEMFQAMSDYFNILVVPKIDKAPDSDENKISVYLGDKKLGLFTFHESLSDDGHAIEDGSLFETHQWFHQYLNARDYLLHYDNVLFLNSDGACLGMFNPSAIAKQSVH
jgi:hypothetical protein